MVITLFFSGKKKQIRHIILFLYVLIHVRRGALIIAHSCFVLQVMASTHGTGIFIDVRQLYYYVQYGINPLHVSSVTTLS